jgi:hypothetical protein
MGIITFLLAVATLVLAAIIVIVSVFDTLTVEFTRKSRPPKREKNKKPQKGNQPSESATVPASVPSQETFDAAFRDVGKLIDEALQKGSASTSTGQRVDMKEMAQYRDRFLVHYGAPCRRTTAIDTNLHRRIRKFLSATAPDISLVSYINNILAHHLEQFSDEIDELYRRETEKPL